jgi:hypothetical protein
MRILVYIVIIDILLNIITVLTVTGCRHVLSPSRALVKSIGVNASALYIALFLFIYYSKNKEYCLDMIGLKCLYHIIIDPQSRLSIPGPRFIYMLMV